MKLTNAMRDETIDLCVNATFKKANADYDAARTRLADTVYEHAFGAQEKIALKLPANWVARVQYVDISCDGFSWRGVADKPYSKLKLSRERLEPQNVNDGYKISLDHPQYAEAQSVVAMFDKLYAAKTQLRQSLRTLLYSTTTLEKLREIWPEGKKFYPAPAERAAALPVPAALTQQINSMIGLRREAA